MPDIHLPQLSTELHGAIAAAERAADETPLTVPPRITEHVEPDPPLQFSQAFRRHLPARFASATTVTRRELLNQGSKISPEAPASELQEFLFLVNAWGYGTSGYGVSRTLRVLADSDRFLSSARTALTLIHDGKKSSAGVEAYYFLNNQREGHVKGWGPSYFTKFLAFADPANQPAARPGRSPALILDRWIAAAMNQFLPKTIGSNRSGKPSSLRAFRQSAWTTPQYAYYLRLAERLAQEPTFKSPPCDGRPMSVERVLFHYARSGSGGTGVR